MLSATIVLCNFSGMLQDFPGFSDVGMGKERKRAEVWGEEKNQMFPYIMALAVCDKKLLPIKIQAGCGLNTQLISQAFIDNEDLKELENCCL